MRSQRTASNRDDPEEALPDGGEGLHDLDILRVYGAPAAKPFGSLTHGKQGPKPPNRPIPPPLPTQGITPLDRPPPNPMTLPMPQVLSRHTPHSRAFSLIELLIVIAILGILAALSTASVASATLDTRRTAFVSELRVLVQAATLHLVREGRPVRQAPPGTLHADLIPFLPPQSADSAVSPIGGEWHLINNTLGVQSGAGIVFTGRGPTRDDSFMARIDQMIDDGNLTTGIFQKLDSNAYYYIAQR